MCIKNHYRVWRTVEKTEVELEAGLIGTESFIFFKSLAKDMCIDLEKSYVLLFPGPGGDHIVETHITPDRIGTIKRKYEDGSYPLFLEDSLLGRCLRRKTGYILNNYLSIFFKSFHPPWKAIERKGLEMIYLGLYILVTPFMGIAHCSGFPVNCKNIGTTCATEKTELFKGSVDRFIQILCQDKSC